MSKEQENEQKIIGIMESLKKENPDGAGVLGLMADAAIQRFEPGGRKHVPRLYHYFSTYLKEGVPLETIRKVVRLAREQ